MQSTERLIRDFLTIKPFIAGVGINGTANSTSSSRNALPERLCAAIIGYKNLSSGIGRRGFHPVSRWNVWMRSLLREI
jgi:hypothetical protein